MIAAQVVLRVMIGKDSYTHMNPGAGKSFTIMLTVKLLRKKGYNKEIIIMTVNNFLVRQLQVCA